MNLHCIVFLTQITTLYAIPNFILILLDDAGIGDISAFGEPCPKSSNLKCPNSVTPHIDNMAKEGTIFHQFYSTSAVCSPSRAGILTGRYPIRTGIYPGVLTLRARTGLPKDEVTIAENLKKKNYYSAFIGKWHLGFIPNFLPTNHGFDYYYGLPISHNNCPCNKKTVTRKQLKRCEKSKLGCPVLENETVVQQPADFETIEENYASKVLEQIDFALGEGSPFFIHYSLHHPHYPTFRSSSFKRASFNYQGRRDYYGDAMLEADYQISRVIEHVKLKGIEDNTYVFLTSDNGPNVANSNSHLFGSPGRFRCGKTSTFEGGYRVGGIVWGGKTRVNHSVENMISHVDLFPTIMSLANVEVPNDRIIDGVDFSNLFLNSGNNDVPRNHIFFYGWKHDQNLIATRYDKYKLYHVTKGFRNKLCERKGDKDGEHTEPIVFNLELDPSESNPMDTTTTEYQDVVNMVTALEQNHGCFLPEDEQCDRSTTFYCTGGTNSEEELLYNGLSVPYSKSELFCCKSNEQAIVPKEKIEQAYCQPCETCSIKEDGLCNPVVLLHGCEGLYCVDKETLVGSCYEPENGKVQTKCKSKQERIEYCHPGYFYCRSNGKCKNKRSKCQNKVLYEDHVCE